jgi:hypothetical protein
MIILITVALMTSLATTGPRGSGAPLRPLARWLGAGGAAPERAVPIRCRRLPGLVPRRASPWTLLPYASASAAAAVPTPPPTRRPPGAHAAAPAATSRRAHQVPMPTPMPPSRCRLYELLDEMTDNGYPRTTWSDHRLLGPSLSRSCAAAVPQLGAPTACTPRELAGGAPGALRALCMTCRGRQPAAGEGLRRAMPCNRIRTSHRRGFTPMSATRPLPGMAMRCRTVPMAATPLLR